MPSPFLGFVQQGAGVGPFLGVVLITGAIVPTSIAIGTPITGGAPLAVLFEDLASNLSFNASFTFNPATGNLTLPGQLLSRDVVKTFADTNYLLLATDQGVRWNTAGGNCVQRLPSLATVRGQTFPIIKQTSDANTLTITPDAANSIADNALGVSLVLAGGAARTASLYAPLTGVDWVVL